VQGACTQYSADVCTSSSTCPGGTTTQNVVCGYPNCAQTGSRQVCPVAEQTATGYNYFYKLYLIKSVNGVITVEQQFDIGENFKALGVLGIGPNLAGLTQTLPLLREVTSVYLAILQITKKVIQLVQYR